MPQPLSVIICHYYHLGSGTSSGLNMVLYFEEVWVGVLYLRLSNVYCTLSIIIIQTESGWLWWFLFRWVRADASKWKSFGKPKITSLINYSGHGPVHGLSRFVISRPCLWDLCFLTSVLISLPQNKLVGFFFLQKSVLMGLNFITQKNRVVIGSSCRRFFYGQKNAKLCYKVLGATTRKQNKKTGKLTSL